MARYNSFSFEHSDSAHSSKKGSWLSRNRTAVIVIVVLVIVIALGLGLGLGLGLNNGSPAAVVGCHATPVPSGQQKQKTDWKLQIPSECPSKLSCPAGKTSPTLLVLSLDGFRADYLLRGNMTKTLDYLISCGTHAPYMRSVFPTKTFPNHYTIATGLYPESHGIIDNHFYDPEYRYLFSYGGVDTNDNRWWLGDPIWNTAKRAGKKVGAMMWPGTEVNIGNMRSDVCYQYNEKFSLDDRVKTVLSWFDGDPSSFPDLVMLYFEQPDSAGHLQGPFGDLVNGNLTYVDGLVNQLLAGFRDRNMQDCLDFVVLADHGMLGIDCDRTVDLSDYIETAGRYTVYTGVHARMSSQYFITARVKTSTGTKSTGEPNPNPVPVDVTLSELMCRHYNTTRDWYVRFHKKQDLPKRYHYCNNRCIDEIVMDLEEDYYLANLQGTQCSVSGGSHGADNTYKSMHALFIGAGPSFLQNYAIDGFENIELYNLFSELLGITPSPNNGTKGVLSPLLKKYTPTDHVTTEFNPADRCPYPEKLEEREQRRNESDCVASSGCLGLKTVEEVDKRLNLSDADAESFVKRVLPYGAPSGGDVVDSDFCVLVQEDYVSGYSEKYQMPLWTAFTIRQQSVSRTSIVDGHYLTDASYEGCARADVRLPGGIDCSNYRNESMNITGNLLFHPGLSKSNDTMTDAFLSTNLVPMYTGFKNGIWKETLHLLEEYATKYSELHVVLGPLFDYNADGLNDSFSDIKQFTKSSRTVPVPTHYFVVASFCNSTALTPPDCANATRTLSFILPHTNTDNNCRDQLPLPDRYLRQNTGRVRDIELLTGLAFFENMNSFYRLKLLTYLSEELWPRISWLDVNDECPNLSTPSCPSSYPNDPPLLLISLDGFRPDYLDKKLSPILDRLHKCGVTTPYMKSIYPTLTFPNHHSISTGLYPETHGIIDNSMYDLKLSQSFYLGSPNAINPAWWFGEPIWNTLIKNNKSAMTYFWPGSDVKIGGTYPTEYFMYNGAVPYSVRVDQALKWLDGSAGQYPSLIVLYFSKVDEGGHEGGPGSLQVDEAIEAVDEALHQLMDGIYHLKMHTCVNMIVVSDHGMSDISCERSVLMNSYLSETVLDKTYMYPGAAGRISNKYYRVGNDYFHIPENQQVPLDDVIKPLKCKSTNMIALDKHQLPRHLHYINQDRIDDVLLVMADTWLTDKYSPWCPIKGQHGWDPKYSSMEALFIGYGPGFKNKTVVETFENIELYNVMAYLTGVTPAPNNGTEGSLYDLLSNPPTLPSLGAGTSYVSCTYPPDDSEYEMRANLTNTGCHCSQSSSEIKIHDDRLDLSASDQNNLETIHVAHGRPVIEHDDTICILHHADFVSGYSHHLKMPVWTSFDLTSAQVQRRNVSVDCTRPDVRLLPDQQVTCEEYQKVASTGIRPVFLFPPEWSSTANSTTDSLLLSNQVPMYQSFTLDVWNYLLDYVTSLLASSSSHLQVVFGPIFDHNADGLLDNTTRQSAGRSDSDVLIPSHYYVILLRCNGTGGCSDDKNFDPLTFILPHWNNSRSENCQEEKAFLFQNVARIRDVELLTGLRFLNASMQISIRRRVQLPERLWA